MRKTILLIDEDKQELDLFRDILGNTSGSFRCMYAPGGQEALHMLQKLTPDFVFVDFDLSGIDVMQLLSAIRFEARLKSSKVFLYAGAISDETSKMARTLGAAGCIERSGDISNLTHQVKAILAEELMPPYAFLKDY